MNKHKVSYCLLFLVSVSNTVHAQQPSNKIPDVVVQNHSHHTSVSGASKHTLTRQQFALKGATSLSDALQGTSGIQLHDSSGNGSRPSVSMRGFGANAASNTLILINGIPLSNPDLAPPDLNTLPLEDINRVEVIAGSESVLYGDQAVGGVINIITDEANEKNIRLQCGAGSYLSKECHARLANQYRLLNYQLNLTSSESANYREHNRYYNNTLLGGISYRQQKNYFAADYKFTNEYMQYPGALTAAQVWQNRRQANNAINYFKDNNQYLHFRFEKPAFEQWKFGTDAFVRGMSGNGVLSVPFTQSRGSLFLKPQLTKITDDRRYHVGADLRLDRYHLESSFGLTNNNQTQGGVFGLMNYNLTKKLALILGARGAQQNTSLNTNISSETINRAAAATLGITYDIYQDLAFYLRRAGNYRFPKAEENTAGHVPLRTQRGVSYESGITYENNESAIDFSLYQLNLRDEIAFDPLQTPTNPFGTNTNLAPTTRNGGSLALKRQITKTFVTDAQINYADARFQNGVNAGKQIPLVSNLTARGGILYRFTNRLSAYTEAVFTGRQYPANDNANVTGGVGGYTIYNFNLRYQYQSFTAALHLNNIFSKYYYLYTVYQTGTEYFYPAPDRNFMLTVNYTFD